MKSKSTQQYRLWSLALLLMLMCLPQMMWAQETGVWTRSVGTHFGKCYVNNNTVISYNGLNSTSAWGDNSVQDKDDLGTPNCKGTQFTGKTDSKDEKLMTISIFQQQYTIPAYTKIVRTSNFKTVMATSRYKHGAGLYLFDDYTTASTATLDVMPDQNQATSQGDCVIKATDNDGNHTWHNADRSFTFDNSTSATAATIIKYAAFAHVTCAYSNTGQSGLEWAGFREDFTDTYIYCATVSYNSNGGSGSMSSTSITGSGSLSSCAFTSPNPGYKYFKCWNTRSDGTGTSYAANETFSTSESVKGPVTLYAIWGDCNFDSDGIFTSTSGEKYYQPATKNSSGVYEITNKGKMMWFSQNAGSLYDQ